MEGFVEKLTLNNEHTISILISHKIHESFERSLSSACVSVAYVKVSLVVGKEKWSFGIKT